MIASLNTLVYVEWAKGWCCTGGWAGPWMVGGNNRWWIPLHSLAGFRVRGGCSWEGAAPPVPPAPSPHCLWVGRQGGCWVSWDSSPGCEGAIRVGGSPLPCYEHMGDTLLYRGRSIMFLSIFNKLGENLHRFSIHHLSYLNMCTWLSSSCTFFF